MSILNAVNRAFRFVSEGLTELFRPTQDQYPDIGVQPFEGEPYSEWTGEDK